MFDDMIADMESNKKLNKITELFLRGRKLISPFFYHNLISKCLNL